MGLDFLRRRAVALGVAVFKLPALNQEALPRASLVILSRVTYFTLSRMRWGGVAWLGGRGYAVPPIVQPNPGTRMIHHRLLHDMSMLDAPLYRR